MNDKNIIPSAASVMQQKIAAYFGEVENTVSVYMMGRIPVVDIDYVDFKTTREVRQDLEKQIKNIEIRTLHRGYSRDKYLDAVECVFDTLGEIYTVNESGLMTSINLRDLVEERLYFINF